jgi:hypothetical protein
VQKPPSSACVASETRSLMRLKLRGLTHCRKWQQVPFVRRSAHKAKSIRRLGALASKPAWTWRLDLGQGEVVVAARNQRATATASVHRQAFTSVLTQ